MQGFGLQSRSRLSEKGVDCERSCLSNNIGFDKLCVCWVGFLLRFYLAWLLLPSTVFPVSSGDVSHLNFVDPETSPDSPVPK